MCDRAFAHMFLTSVALFSGFIGLMASETIVKPVAVAVFDIIVLPGLAEVFRTRINPEMGHWLATKNGEELASAIAQALRTAIVGFEKKPVAVQKKAVERVLKMYRPDINATQLRESENQIYQKVDK